jgi:hypothetical protein
MRPASAPAHRKRSKTDEQTVLADCARASARVETMLAAVIEQRLHARRPGDPHRDGRHHRWGQVLKPQPNRSRGAPSARCDGGVCSVDADALPFRPCLNAREAVAGRDASMHRLWAQGSDIREDDAPLSPGASERSSPIEFVVDAADDDRPARAVSDEIVPPVV